MINLLSKVDSNNMRIFFLDNSNILRVKIIANERVECYYCYMSELKNTIAANLAELRKAKKLTQSELAEKFNYSDKSISKWEHGDALPDIEVLVELCKFYGVSLDYLTTIHEGVEINIEVNPLDKVKHIIIATLIISIVWICATMFFVWQLINTNSQEVYWVVFVWAIPISAIIAMIFNGVWGKKILSFPMASIFIWSLIVSLYLEFLYRSNYTLNLWMLFLVGIPTQTSIILWSTLKSNKLNNKSNKKK